MLLKNISASAINFIFGSLSPGEEKDLLEFSPSLSELMNEKNLLLHFQEGKLEIRKEDGTQLTTLNSAFREFTRILSGTDT